MEQEKLSMGKCREYGAIFEIRELAILFFDMIEENYEYKSNTLSVIREITEAKIEELMDSDLSY